MLADHQIKIVQDLVADLSKEEIIWLNGYLNGLVSSEKKTTAAVPRKSELQKITIAYGTETGNSKKLAISLAARAKKQGISSRLVNLSQYKPDNILNEEWFFTIISTHGEGEPPAAAKKFYDYLHGENISLGKLNFGVLALGDTSYPLFCKAGEDVDQQLSRLGGKRLLPLQKLDTDYEEDAALWFESVLQTIGNNPAGTQTKTTLAVKEKKTSGKQYHTGTVQTHINLNGRGSSKETYHIELAAEGVSYQPGDAVGIIPFNPSELAEKIISISGISADTMISYKTEEQPLEDLLTKRLSLLHLPERVVKKYAEIVQQEIPDTRMDFFDLLRIYPISNPDQFLAALHILDPVTPRLYSIASSPEAHPGEVHLTVGLHNFRVNGQLREGLCSSYLSQREEGEAITFYIHKNHLFKLPAADADVIMIGAGTGIAPFRSFLAHRDATGASGRNWLFFGDRHFTTDFLYQTEWLNWIDTGVLTKMNVAFSRDGAEKYYVQHKIWQQRNELIRWMEKDASIYICGAKEPMSVDVEQMIIKIISHQKKISLNKAAEYLNGWKDEGRYVKDVY